MNYITLRILPTFTSWTYFAAIVADNNNYAVDFDYCYLGLRRRLIELGRFVAHLVLAVCVRSVLLSHCRLVLRPTNVPFRGLLPQVFAVDPLQWVARANDLATWNGPNKLVNSYRVERCWCPRVSEACTLGAPESLT